MRYEITLEVDDLALTGEINESFDPVAVVVAAKDSAESQGGQLTQWRINGRAGDPTFGEGESPSESPSESPAENVESPT